MSFSFARKESVKLLTAKDAAEISFRASFKFSCCSFKRTSDSSLFTAEKYNV
jgi:hypothetical protein